MPPRLMAFLLVLILLWSGALSAVQARVTVAQSDAPSCCAAAQPPSAPQLDPPERAAPGTPYTGTPHTGTPPTGTLNHHLLDDQPLSPLGETPAEGVALLPSAPSRCSPALRMAEPGAPPPNAHTGPWLEGPLRPPCRA